MATRVGCVYNYHRTLDLSGWFWSVLKAMGGVVKAMGRCFESDGNAFWLCVQLSLDPGLFWLLLGRKMCGLKCWEFVWSTRVLVNIKEEWSCDVGPFLKFTDHNLNDFEDLRCCQSAIRASLFYRSCKDRKQLFGCFCSKSGSVKATSIVLAKAENVFVALWKL